MKLLRNYNAFQIKLLGERMVKKYIRKTPPVEAFQWLGNNWAEIKSWVDERENSKYYPLYRWNEGNPESAIFVRTVDGEMKANIGDWIIRTRTGEYLPCKNFIFVKEYYAEDDEIELCLEDLL